MSKKLENTEIESVKSVEVSAVAVENAEITAIDEVPAVVEVSEPVEAPAIVDEYGLEIKQDDNGRLWWCTRSYYYETHDKDGNVTRNITEAEWREEIIAEFSDVKNLNITWIYFGFHDRDRDGNGGYKPLHVHFLVRTSDKITQSMAMKRFKCSCKQNCQVPKYEVQALRYIIHKTEEATNEMKYSYDESIVYSFFDDTVKNPKSYYEKIAISPYMQNKAKKQAENNAKAVLDGYVSSNILAILKGEKTLAEVFSEYNNEQMNSTYGTSIAMYYRLHRKIYEQAHADWFSKMSEWYAIHKRCLCTFYIVGDGQSGKSVLATFLAEKFADKRGIHRPACAGLKTTFDFTGKYKGEMTSILNEFGKGFSLDQFLDMFDPLQAPVVNSRYCDKPWFAQTCFLTSSYSVEHFIYDMCKREPLTFTLDNDKVRQIRRRIPILISLENGLATVYYLKQSDNSTHCCYFDSGCGLSPAYKVFKADIPYNTNDINSMENLYNIVFDTYKEYYNPRINPEINFTPWHVEQPVIEI